MSVQIEALKNAIYYLQRDGHISLDFKESLDDYVDSINDNKYSKIDYSQFDQGSSSDYTFDDEARTATNSTGGTANLLTNTLNIGNAIVKSFKVEATTEDVTIQITKDGTNYYDVDSYNCNETITTTDTFKVRIKSPDNVIKSFMIIYDSTY